MIREDLMRLIFSVCRECSGGAVNCVGTLGCANEQVVEQGVDCQVAREWTAKIENTSGEVSDISLEDLKRLAWRARAQAKAKAGGETIGMKPKKRRKAMKPVKPLKSEHGITTHPIVQGEDGDFAPLEFRATPEVKDKPIPKPDEAKPKKKQKRKKDDSAAPDKAPEPS